MKNIRALTGISIFTLILLGCCFPPATAGECDYGSMYAWYSIDGEIWENATAHPTLKLGEEFEVKTTIFAKVDLASISLKLHEFGTPVFEVIDDSENIDEWIDWFDLEANDSYTYNWKLRVRPNTTWTKAYAPLEIFSQFDEDDEHNCIVSFGVIAAYIEDEIWEGYNDDSNITPENGNETPGAPGFELFIIICSIVIILFSKRRQIH